MLQGNIQGDARVIPQVAQGANRQQPVQNPIGDSSGGDEGVAASSKIVEDEARKSEAVYRRPASAV